MTPLYRFGRAVLSPLFRLLYPFRVLHHYPLPEGQRIILCSNHITMKDPVFLAITQKPQLYFMAKAELFQNKLFAKMFYALGAFPVHRGKGDVHAANATLDLLNDEKALGIFIEGTRSKDGNLLKPKPGVVIFSSQTNSPIIPVAIAAKGGKIRLFRKVVINYGEMIDPKELNICENTSLEYRNASRYVMAKISALYEEALAELENK